VEAVLHGLRHDGGAEATRAALVRWRGVRIAGVDPSFREADLIAAASALPGRALAAVVDALVDDPHGASGLPDLLVLPGPDIQLDAVPARLDGGACLVELKTEHDHLSDAQALWHDRLLQWSCRVERWNVAARSEPTDGAPPRPRRPRRAAG
jgi:hypothetical protein